MSTAYNTIYHITQKFRICAELFGMILKRLTVHTGFLAVFPDLAVLVAAHQIDVVQRAIPYIHLGRKNGNTLHIVALIKGVFADLVHSLRNGNGGETLAAFKGVLAYERQAFGKRDGFQTVRHIEGIGIH